MIEFALTPVAMRLELSSATPRGTNYWGSLLNTLLDRLAEPPVEFGRYLVGHIKFFASLQERGYLRGSKVSARLPADIEIQCDSSQVMTKIQVTLNVLIYTDSGYSLSDHSLHVVRQVACLYEAQVYVK